MKLALLFLLFAATLGAQDLSFTIVKDPSGNTVNQPLGSAYTFPNVSADGGDSEIKLQVTNTTNSQIQLVTVIPNHGVFGVRGTYSDYSLSAGASESFQVYFLPALASAGQQAVGPASADLQIEYTLNSGTPNSETKTITVCTLSGTGTDPTLPAYAVIGSGNSTLVNVVDGITFPNTSLSSSSTATISLVNDKGSNVIVPISIASTNALNPAIAFSTDAPPGGIAVPANNADSPVQFTVTFGPGQAAQASATLQIGSNSYPLVGTGVVVADIDALQISYVDSTGVRTSPQAATPISFGQPTEGTSAKLTFTVANPITSFNAVSLSSISVAGTGFTVSGLPVMPSSIAPGTSISFIVTFAPSQSGTFTGSLSVGTRVFGLTGIGADLPIPTASLVFDTTNFTSQQQPHISVQFASPSTITAIGTLTMQFTSSVANVQDDPAVKFLATSGRSLQVTVAVGGTSATYNGQSELTFQTGTTAGTILFTLTFPNKQPITQQITIAPALVQITQMTAVAQDPFLVVTMTGYDNTYSTGPMTFNFYDTTGKVIASNMAVNATPNFQQYFGATTSGGAFSVQLSFPTSGGSISSVGSVSATMSNSVGTSTLSQANF